MTEFKNIIIHKKKKNSDFGLKKFIKQRKQSLKFFNRNTTPNITEITYGARFK